MSHDTVYSGRKVAYHIRNEADAERVRKIARDVTALLKTKGLHNVANVNFIGNMAVVEVI